LGLSEVKVGGDEKRGREIEGRDVQLHPLRIPPARNRSRASSEMLGFGLDVGNVHDPALENGPRTGVPGTRGRGNS
jgi:hypothetical protein